MSDKQYVLLITNTFDERTSSVYGVFTEKEAQEKIEILYNKILEEKDGIESESYENATIEGDIKNGWFSIDWGDDTYTDYTVATIDNLGWLERN